MHQPAILSLATGVPPTRYSQADIFDYFYTLHGNTANSNYRVFRRIFERTGVHYRHSVIDPTFYRQERTTQERNQRYVMEAIPLGEATIRRCLDAGGFDPRDVDDLLVVSCTGMEIPGLDLHLAGRIGMRPDLRRTCILGMGCYAAFPALLRAREAAQSGRQALILTLELCTLHLQIDSSLENVVSSALFADGAAAILVGPGKAGHYAGPRLLDSATYCDYTTFEHMAFTLTDHGFKMHLTAYVPDLLAAQVEPFVDGLLDRTGLARRDVRFWGIHPGSSKILDHVEQRLGLSAEQMGFSRVVLQNYGNMSSPTILFVLDEIQRCGKPTPGDYGVLLAFGPGLTMEGCLVQW